MRDAEGEKYAEMVQCPDKEPPRRNFRQKTASKAALDCTQQERSAIRTGACRNMYRNSTRHANKQSMLSYNSRPSVKQLKNRTAPKILSNALVSKEASSAVVHVLVTSASSSVSYSRQEQ